MVSRSDEERTRWLEPYAEEIESNPELKASLERQHRYFEARFANGNNPDRASARRHWAALEAHVATLEPTGRTEEEARELIARHCPRRSFFR